LHNADRSCLADSGQQPGAAVVQFVHTGLLYTHSKADTVYPTLR
jgi:hypothetical protein